MTHIDRFDDVLDRDWDRFREHLAGRIVALAGSESIVMRADGPRGPSTCVQIRVQPDGCVTVDVAGADTVTRSLSHADELARHVVSVLREHRNIVHPVFLQTDGGLAFGGLRDRVADTLARHLDRPAPVDADGDFVVVLDSHAVFVIVDRTSPRIQLWAPLLHGIAERAVAAEELVDLNREWPHIKVVLVEDRLVATADVLGDPFVPRHLTELLEMLRVFLGTVDARFAQRFDGARYSGEIDIDTEETLFDEPPP